MVLRRTGVKTNYLTFDGVLYFVAGILLVCAVTVREFDNPTADA